VYWNWKAFVVVAAQQVSSNATRSSIVLRVDVVLNETLRLLLCSSIVVMVVVLWLLGVLCGFFCES